MGIRFGLQRHFPLKREFHIISDTEFSKSNQFLRQQLKWQGLGKVDHHSPIAKEVLEKIQTSYNPSSPDPKSEKYTYHCIRAMAVSFLDECNFEARHIMRVSGHKSVQAPFGG